MRDGVRVINCARGELVDDAALKDALDTGKVAGAALDVFPCEPITDYPLFDGYPNVVVTPHLGASTTEAQDRAGVQTAEQVVAALTGGVVVDRGEHPRDQRPRTWTCSARSSRSPTASGRLAMTLAEGSSVDRVEVEYFGRIAERDTRLLTLAVLQGVLAGHCEEDVNLVNAPSLAEERGIGVSERKETVARDFTDLVRDHDRHRRRALPRRRHDARPPGPPAPARGVGPALQPPARRGRAPRAVPLLRPAGHDGPRRHRARRARREHLLRRRRPPAAGRGRPPQRGRGHGRHHRLAGPARRRRRDRGARDGFLAGRAVSL